MRSRRAWCQMVSPLRAEKLSVAKFLQLDCGAELAWSLRPAFCSGSGTSSVTPSIKTGAEEATDRDMASEVCASSLVCAWWLPEPPDWTWDMERTTSPLQIGQVRRRVVSHGVLERKLAKCYLDNHMIVSCHLHAIHMELMATWQAHDPTFAIDVLLKTNNTLHLPSSILSPPQCRSCLQAAFFFLG